MGSQARNSLSRRMGSPSTMTGRCDDDGALRRLHQDAALFLQAAGQQVGQGVDAVHPKDEVDVGVAFAHLFHDLLLVGHAAAQPDQKARLFLLEALEGPDVAEDPLLGVLPHGAGVEEDQVGLFGGVAQAVADVSQDAFQPLAVVDVLLAAVAVDIGQGRGVVAAADRLCGGRAAFVSLIFQRSTFLVVFGRFGSCPVCRGRAPSIIQVQPARNKGKFTLWRQPSRRRSPRTGRSGSGRSR